jgi:hypothetical protein
MMGIQVDLLLTEYCRLGTERTSGRMPEGFIVSVPISIVLFKLHVAVFF